MIKPKTSRSKSKSASSPVVASPPPPASLAAPYTRFASLAEQLPAEQVVPCRLDVNLIFANVQAGLAAVLPHTTRLTSELPMLHVEQFPELEELAGALLHAAAQTAVSAAPIKREQLDKMLARLHELREPMLLCAEALALLNLIPKRRVEQIRSGKGAFDAAQDGVALADLFGEFAAVLHHKHPFTDTQFTEIAELGHTLMRVIVPDGARVAPSPQAIAAAATRDRLYTLLLIRHTDLRRAGFYLFADDVDQKVPVLGARRSRGKSDPAASEPVPAPAAPGVDPAAAAR